MSWKDLLDSGSERTLPWYGFKTIHDSVRSWTVSGPQPPEHGWFLFSTAGGRSAQLIGREPQALDPAWGEAQPKVYGYLVGDRLIPDAARVDPDPDKLIEQTNVVYCVEPGLERFARASVVRDRAQRLVYYSQEFPTGPEEDVVRAYQDRAENVSGVSGVTPALDLAFRWASLLRLQKEERQREIQRIREAEEKRLAEEVRVRKLMKDASTAVGRRALAAVDFETAAREALRVSGAELLDVRQARNRNEMVVQYRFRQRRLECVVDKTTMGVLDAGVCLTDHKTGIKGDTLFTLESLPGVIGEAIQKKKLVVWRHVDDEDQWDDEEDW